MTPAEPSLPPPIPPSRGILHQVSWREVLPSLTLGRAVGMAASPRTLLLALLGLLFTWGGWLLLALLFAGSDDPTVQAQVEAIRVQPWDWRYPPACPVIAEHTRGTPLEPAAEAAQALFRLDLAPLGGRDLPVIARPSLPAWALLIACNFWWLAVWAYFGGAICRIAAVKYATEHYRFRAGLRHARNKWTSYFSAPIMPLIFSLLPALFILPLGLLTLFDAGFVISAIFWPFAILAGLAIAILMVGLTLGWPLLWGNLSIEENSDAFDAVGRMYSYVGGRPLHYAFYLLLSAVFGCLGWFAVSWFVSLAYAAAARVAGAFTSGERAQELAVAGNLLNMGVGDSVGFHVMSFWAAAGRLLVIAYGVSFLWNAFTIIYFLLRQEVDRVPIDDVYRDEPLDTSGLPKLKADAAGVATLADNGEPGEPATTEPIEPG